jgi:hypothetical protein
MQRRRQELVGGGNRRRTVSCNPVAQAPEGESCFRVLFQPCVIGILASVSTTMTNTAALDTLSQQMRMSTPSSAGMVAIAYPAKDSLGVSPKKTDPHYDSFYPAKDPLGVTQKKFHILDELASLRKCQSSAAYSHSRVEFRV